MKVLNIFRAFTPLLRTGVVLAPLIGLWVPQWAHAAPVCAPSKERPVLKLQPAKNGTPQACDLKGLRQLPAKEITAVLPAVLGLPGQNRWRGVSLRLLVERLGGGADSRIQLRALDAYTIDIPWSDLARFDPILAYSRNNEPMSIRDKGPLILIYPFGSDPQLQSPDFANRTIWQVNEIIVR